MGLKETLTVKHIYMGLKDTMNERRTPTNGIFPSVNGSMKKDNSEDNDIVVVLPGDSLISYMADSTALQKEPSTPPSSVRIGIGLRQDPTQHVHATCAGRLMRRRIQATETTKYTQQEEGIAYVYFVEPSKSGKRRYRPALEDRIVGIVVDRMGTDGGADLYRIDIRAAHYAILSNLHFEGATKRNKPQLQPGQLIYARIQSCDDPLLDPTLSCMNGPLDMGLSRKDWMTQEGVYGELRGDGTLCRISPRLARQLLDPTGQDNVVLTELAQCKNLAFELAIGVNGYVWIHSSVPEYTLLIQNAIQNSEVLTAPQIRAMVKNLVYLVEKQRQRRSDAVSSG
jgi:exosome complex component RRP40